MAALAVIAIGADRPGIVAAVAQVLRDRGGNVEDSAMTILGGHFAMMLLVTTDSRPEDLRSALQDATAELGLTISVTPAAGGHRGVGPTHVLSVYGSDRPGILAGVTQSLADAGANITDLETRVLSADEDPIYAMVIEVALPEAGADDDVADRLAATCAELGVDHTLRPIETETY